MYVVQVVYQVSRRIMTSAIISDNRVVNDTAEELV